MFLTIPVISGGGGGQLVGKTLNIDKQTIKNRKNIAKCPEISPAILDSKSNFGMLKFNLTNS
jgi:hypothetical protein